MPLEIITLSGLLGAMLFLLTLASAALKAPEKAIVLVDSSAQGKRRSRIRRAG